MVEYIVTLEKLDLTENSKHQIQTRNSAKLIENSNISPSETLQIIITRMYEQLQASVNIEKGVALRPEDVQIRYRLITDKCNYLKLLKTGMFWEHHPELTGDWETDKELMKIK